MPEKRQRAKLQKQRKLRRKLHRAHRQHRREFSKNQLRMCMSRCVSRRRHPDQIRTTDVHRETARQEMDRMADTITVQTATDQPVHRETVHTEIIMARVDIIIVTMVTDQPVREITEARDQTVETRDRSTTEDRDRDSIRETATEDAIITSVEEITVED